MKMEDFLRDLKAKKQVREMKFNALKETDQAELWYYMGQLVILDYVINCLEGETFSNKTIVGNDTSFDAIKKILHPKSMLLDIAGNKTFSYQEWSQVQSAFRDQRVIYDTKMKRLIK